MDFHKITCSPCAPDSDVFYNHIWNNWFDLRICKSFCTKYASLSLFVLLLLNALEKDVRFVQKRSVQIDGQDRGRAVCEWRLLLQSNVHRH